MTGHIEPLMLYDWPTDDVESYWTEGHDAAEIDDMNPDAVPQHLGSSVVIRDAKPQNCVHSRLVLSSFGWPLSKFKSLLELFGALCDAVSGHQDLCRRGVLHRDISPGNILITGLKEPDRGILIDLDYGIKLPRENEPLADDGFSGTVHFVSGELLNNEAYEISPDVTSTSTNLEQTTAISDEELQPLEHLVQEPKTAAAEVSDIQHADHHDLEALFWTLCYLCIAREGPGISRTTWPDRNTAERGAIPKTLSEYFYEGNPHVIASKKASLLATAKTFETKILDSFAPYFAPCKYFVKHLYGKLRKAYQTRNFKDLHNNFRHAFATAVVSPLIQDWHSRNEEYRKMEEQEEKRREEDKKGRFDSYHKIDTKELKKKRAHSASPRSESTESAPSVSHQPRTKRAKRIPCNDPPSSPSARAVTTRSRNATTQSSSATQGRNLRSKTRTSSQNLPTQD